MQKTHTELREERIQALLDECQAHIIAQMIEPFGLTPAMFEDRDGGNVTTLHNFSQESDQFVHERDRASHAQSRETYEREKWVADDFSDTSKRHRATGRDGLTGSRREAAEMDTDHIISLKEIASNPKAHLAMRTGEGLDDLRELANADPNLLATHKSINRSKGDRSLEDFAAKEGKRFKLKEKRVAAAVERSREHVDGTFDRELLKKQGGELLESGKDQAVNMGLREGLGVLLVELVHGLVKEVRELLRRGLAEGQSWLGEVRTRFMKVIRAVAAKVPDALGRALDGGIAGFLSNLLTFILNQFLSTAKRIVTVIREGLVGLFRAFKMIFFPPAHLTRREALQAGLKILATVVVSTLGLLFGEALTGFIASIPVLAPFAGVLGPGLMAIITGIASAFIAYLIDRKFDRMAMRERMFDEMMADARRRAAFADELAASTDAALANVDHYVRAITSYQEIGAALGTAAQAGAATVVSLQGLVQDTGALAARGQAGLAAIRASQEEVARILNSLPAAMLPPAGPPKEAAE